MTRPTPTPADGTRRSRRRARSPTGGTVLRRRGRTGVAAASLPDLPARLQLHARPQAADQRPGEGRLHRGRVRQPLGLRHPEAACGPARREGDQRGQDAQGGRRTSAPACSARWRRSPASPPIISKEGTGLDVVDDGGAKDKTDLVFDEDAEMLSIPARRASSAARSSSSRPTARATTRVWQQLARRMIQQDKVDVLVAGFASAEREAIRPIVDQFKQLYFYTNQYEGGVADANTFCTGPVCEQQVIPTVQYMVEKFGPRCYTIAADYNFGQLTAAWTTRLHPAGRRPDHRRGVHPAVGLGVQPGDRPHPAGQARLGDDAAGRPEPSQLLPAGGRGGPQVADGVDRQHGAGLRAQALRAALAGQHAQRHPVPARGADRAQPGLRQALDGDVPGRPVYRRDGAEHLLHHPSLRQGGAPRRHDRPADGEEGARARLEHRGAGGQRVPRARHASLRAPDPPGGLPTRTTMSASCATGR